MARARNPLDLPIFRILQNDLQPLSHDMSLFDSR
jgi:hypothetical protein